MSKAIVILDYNNVFCINHNLTTDKKKSIMNSLLRRIVAQNLTIDYVEIRYYGGWYNDKELTRVGSQVMTDHLTMDLFPMRYGDCYIRGKQVFVETITGTDYIWYNTYRERAGIPRFIINKGVRNDICDNNRTLCPIHILESFSRKRERLCPVAGCTTNNERAFIQMGQKMVDAMMVCDIISVSNVYKKENIESIYVLTDDVDLFPAFAVCRNNASTMDIQLGIINSKNVSLYEEYLKPFNIKVFQLYDYR